jgi:hypothetical protein
MKALVSNQQLRDLIVAGRAQRARITRYVSLLGAGLFAGGAVAVLILEMALRQLDGPAYVRVRQAEHDYFPWYIGALLVPTYAATLVLVILARKAGSPALRPAVAALVLLVLALVVSFAVNAPRGHLLAGQHIPARPQPTRPGRGRAKNRPDRPRPPPNHRPHARPAETRRSRPDRQQLLRPATPPQVRCLPVEANQAATGGCSAHACRFPSTAGRFGEGVGGHQPDGTPRGHGLWGT